MLLESVRPTWLSVLVISVSCAFKLCSTTFEFSLANATSRDTVMQDLWQEVTLMTRKKPGWCETPKISNQVVSHPFRDWSVCENIVNLIGCDKRLTWETPHGRLSAGFSLFVCKFTVISLGFCLVNFEHYNNLLLSPQKMGAECGFQTKQQLNDCILRFAWSEYPLPPVHRACRDGDTLSLTYLTVQGDRLEVFRSINEKDHFLLWTPAHWAAYFGKVSFSIYLKNKS